MTYLFLLSHSPYGSTLAREALDMALAAAAFDQTVQLVFLGDGVFQLLNNQQSELKQKKNISKTLPVLGLYDIDTVYADSGSLTERGIDKAQIFAPCQVIDNAAIQQLIAKADAVMSL